MVKLEPNKDVNGPKVPIWERGQHGGRTRPVDRDVLFKITCEVISVFEKYGIKWCLSHGTALGVVREGDVIPWDDDVDIALIDMNQRMIVATECQRELELLGFFAPPIGNPNLPVNGYEPNTNMPYYDTVFIKEGEKVECWWFEKTNTHYVYDPKREGLAIPRKFMDTFAQIEWRGKMFNIPNHTHEYLDLMYGKDKWQIADKNKKYNPLRVE